MRKITSFKKNIFTALAGIVLCTSFIWNGAENNMHKVEAASYEEVYSDTLKVEGKDVPFKISLNTKDCTDGVIQIDGQSLAINADLSKNVGYAQGKTQTQDFTGDGKEEIALILSGGASGSMQAVQVFGNENGTWKEIAVPADIYSTIPEFMKEQELAITMDSSLVYYRTISIENQKILVKYLIFVDADTKADAELSKELTYSADKKEFVLGDTLVSNNNNCSIKVSATRKAIKINWNAGIKKASIKAAQIKVATKKNMKNAKLYKLSKKKAQKLSYQFTVKSGKITKNQKYYFKVRLKTGKTWTDWSAVKQAKITKRK